MHVSRRAFITGLVAASGVAAAGAVAAVAGVAVGGSPSPSPSGAGRTGLPGPRALRLAPLISGDRVRVICSPVAAAQGYAFSRNGRLVARQAGCVLYDTGLAPGTAYSYEVAAIVNGSETAPAAGTTTTSAGPAGPPPTPPTDVRLTRLTPTTASLVWQHSRTHDKISGYRISRAAGVATPAAAAVRLTQVFTTDGPSTYHATSLAADTQYVFAVQAVDNHGRLSEAGYLAVRTPPLEDRPAPPVPVPGRGMHVHVYSATRLDVLWSPSPTPDVVAYLVFRDGKLLGRVEAPARNRWSDTTVRPGTTYAYSIVAVDAAGQQSRPSPGRAATTPPAGTLLITRGPYLVDMSATSVIVMWWTNEPADSTVEITVGATTTTYHDAAPAVRHAVLVPGLPPGAEFGYTVGSTSAGTSAGSTSAGSTSAGSTSTGSTSAAARSPRHTAHTPARPGTAFTMAFLADYGGGGTAAAEFASRMATGGTRLLQTVGDNVYPDCEDPDPTRIYSDFDARFFRPLAPILASSAFYPALGNKDYYGNGAFDAVLWAPNNQRWYTYDWGDVRVLVLDTEQETAPGSAQHAFATQVLSRPDRPAFLIVVVPNPAFSSTSENSSSIDVRTYLCPLFEAHDVDLVVSANSHNYERSHRLTGGEPAARGPVYVVTGGGGNGLNAFTLAMPRWSAVRAQRYEYLRVDVSAGQLAITAVGLGGRVVDKLAIERGD